jgi:hypothetical protein
MSNYLTNIYQTLRENAKYVDITGLLPLWNILVIPVLQILEDSGKYWLYQYCRCWKIR